MASTSTLLASIFVARLLGTSEYGALGLIQSTLGTCISVLGPGVALTATKFVAEHRTTQPHLAGQMIGLTYATALIAALILAGGLAASARPFAEVVYRAPSLAPLLRPAAIALFLSVLSGAQTGALAGLEAFGSIAVANLVKGLAVFPLMWLLTRSFGIAGAVWATAIVAGIGWLAMEWSLRRALGAARLRVLFRGIWVHARVLVTFSLPAMMTSGMVLVTMLVGNILLTRLPNGYGELGIFSAANQWRAVILFLPNMVVQPFFPMLAGLAGGRRLGLFRRVLVASVVLSSLAALLPAVATAGLALPIMSAYGHEFRVGRGTLLLVATASFLAAGSLGIIQAMNSLGKVWESAGIHALWVAAFFATFAAVAHYGARGLAGAYAVAYLVQLLALVYYVAVPGASLTRESA